MRVKCKMTKFIICMLFLMSFSIWSYADADPIEYDAIQYYTAGFPKQLNTVDDLAKIDYVLTESVKRSILPKYDSKKSSEIFNVVCSEPRMAKTIDSILMIEDEIERKMYLNQMKVSLMHIQSLYSGQNYDGFIKDLYWNESARLKCIELYCDIYLWKAVDNAGAMNIDEKTLLAIVKDLGRKFYPLERYDLLFRKANEETKNLIQKNVARYYEMLRKIKTLNYDNNLKKIGDLY